MLFSPVLERALRLASVAHRDQRRKGTDVPYITHPVQVAWILRQAGFTDEELLAAALLHDVVEDCGVPLEQLAAEFSPRVAEMVGRLSERKTDADGRPRPWEDRKREHVEHLHDAPVDVRALVLADKLHNLQTIALDLAAGVDVWNRFNAPCDRLLWYYRAVIDQCGDDPRLATLATECRAVLRALGAEPTPE